MSGDSSTGSLFHRRFKSATKRWRVQRDSDTRPYFEAYFLFQAADEDEADRLYDAMIDGLGCSHPPEHEEPCKHFRFGALTRLDDVA